VKAILNGVTIAQSNETLLIEGNHYFPADSVDSDALSGSRMRSLCLWKGLASYYHVQAGEHRSRNAAWTYRHPYPWVRKIKNRVAFWNGVQVVPD
jgi:uncharacterized protein (DUF427 family)